MEDKSTFGKDLIIFEQGAVKLPETANEVYTFVRDNLIMQTRELAARVELLADRSAKHTVTDEISAAVSRDLILEKKEIEDAVKIAIGKVKEKAFKLHRGVTAAEKVLKDPLEAISDAETKKIREWVKAEEERKKAIWLAEQERIRKENDKKIAAAQKKADKILEGINNLNEQKVALEHSLDNPEITQEEHDALEAKLRSVVAQLTGKQEDLTHKAGQIADLSRTQPVAIQMQTKLAGTGIKKVFRVKVTNPMQLLMAITNGLVSVSVVDFKDNELKKMANNGGVPSLGTVDKPVIPGCYLEEDIDISTRRA